MEKKDFLKLTEKLLLNYGFVKIGKTFFLDLDRAVIALRKTSDPFHAGRYIYYYNICFKDIHEDHPFNNKEDYKNMPEDLGVYKDVACWVEWAGKFAKTYFTPEDYSEEEWTSLWCEALHHAFDPLRDDFENYVRENLGPEKIGMGIAEKEAFMERGLIFKK